MAISERAEKKLDEMMQSGSSETMGVADILKTISENGGMQETNAYLCVCAQEIIDAWSPYSSEYRWNSLKSLYCDCSLPCHIVLPFHGLNERLR